MIPPEQSAEFVCGMEHILDLYEKPYDPQQPLVCIDEGLKQLISEIRQPLPLTPGQPQRYDYAYEREGSCSFFIAFEPLQGRRQIEVTGQRRMTEYAEFVRQLVDVHYPDADTIHIVQDNLNTHKPASFYEAFPASEAHRILERVSFHYTPKHGSWLNMAEIELSILNSQCLDRRIQSQGFLTSEIQAWVAERDSRQSKIDWQFTTPKARLKLKRLYPSFTD